ncbi:MAG TPA: M15 family metallopeptidase [Symbiobacteriaceae bacterium]
MDKVKRIPGTARLMIVAIMSTTGIIGITGCGNAPAVPPAQEPPAITVPSVEAPSQPKTPAPKTAGAESKPVPQGDSPAVKGAAQQVDIAVLVNKSMMLPPDYKPDDLVEPNVPFIFKEQVEKRLMRKAAAQALERMFTAAKQDGIYLAGVSGYRSFATQKSLFDYYVRTQGEELARKYSAEAGHSEHQTGLAMDVSGSTGQCAADDCFADTPEAKWLAGHAPEYGFIIRYPKGKETVTGYQSEPWHVRYVGTPMSREIAAKGLTLEEYLSLAGPVSRP